MNNNQNIETLDQFNEQVSLKETVLKMKSLISYLKSNLLIILIFGVVGGLIGFLYAFIKPLTYTAKLSFVVEEGKSGSSGLASLAGQFGFDLAGLSGSSSGLLSGENLLLFLKSTSLSKETLLSPYDSSKNYSLADKYADEYGLRKKWASDKSVGKEIFFPVSITQPYTRIQDSLIQVIVNRILKKELLVERPEKKATFIAVSTTMQDELLSKYYCERLVIKAIERYVQSKIKRQQINVNKLQSRADSIGNVVNSKTYKNATDQEKILDINPASRTATVNAETSTRDKMMLVTIYGEVVKNLEIAKVQLSQETPTIQMVDNVDLPLIKSKKMLLIISLLMGFLFIGMSIFYLIVKRILS